MCRCNAYWLVDEKIKIVVNKKRHLKYTGYRRILGYNFINKWDGSEKLIEG
jgi:hypothetical protein